MFPTWMDDELHRASQFASLGLVPLGLIQRDKGIGIAVVDQGGWRIGMEMVNR